MKKKIMSKTRWNNEQENAFKTREGNFLISASAGSGKTAVLTERVYEMIKEGVGLDELLILTFTNLAASNMREKIRGKLLEDNLTKLASMLDAVNIQTFDAFALYLVKKYYYRLNLKNNIKLVDEAIIKLEKNKILNQIFDEYYEARDPEFLDMISYFSINNDDDVKQAIFDIYEKANLSVDFDKMLLEYKTTYFTDEFINNVIDDFIKQVEAQIEGYYEEAKALGSSTDFPGELAKYLELFMNKKSYDELAAVFFTPEISFPAQKKKSMKLDDPNDAPIVNRIKAGMAKIASLFAFKTLKEIKDQIYSTKKYVTLMVDITKELNARLTTFKDKHSSYTFADIFKFAISLAELEDIQNDLKKQYRFIMVDEYQDTNDLQEYFINLFKNNNVFCVGDVKQSIYRFRNANPDIFLKKFNEYSKFNPSKNNQTDARIDLPKNYRSSEEVLQTVNEIFTVVMQKRYTGLDYKNEHMMQAGNPLINKNKSHTSTILNEEIVYSLPDNTTTEEYEARLIASDIRRRIEEKEQVFEKGQYKEISYRNFAILISKKTKFSVYQKVFEEYKIPLFANYMQPIHESDLTLVLESIIKALTNINDVTSNDFRHAMFSILRSFLYSKKEDYIENLLFTNKYEDDDAYKLLLEIKDRSQINSSLKSIILDIIKTFKFNEKIILIGDVNRSLEIMDNYVQIASNMDELEYSLDDFNKYFEELKEFDIEPEFNASSSLDDSVKLMSIHASKGLEFNYVYLPSLASKDKSNNNRIFISNTYGITIPTYKFSKDSTILHDLAVKNDKKEDLLEKLRLFYVALTRAQEKIIFVLNPEKGKKNLNSFEDISSFLDMYLFAKPNVFSRTFTPSEPPENDENKVEESIDFEIKSINKMSKEIKEKRRASKNSETDQIDPKALELGNKYHYYLELVDFKKKDVSFIKDNNDRNIITRFLKNEIFNKDGLVKVAHEYRFYDEVNDINGIIDLLLIYNDHIDIIDFKLSKIDDKEYDKQLSIYKDYISQISNLPIYTYVTSIFKGDVREVK